MKFIIKISIALIILFLFTLCKKNDIVESIDFNYNYIPLNIGQWNEYVVREINHNSTGGHDTINYYLKEIVTDKISSNIYRLERYWRVNKYDNWIIKDVWTREKTSTQYIQTEENVKYTKLIFPIKNNKTWNGNAYNINEEEIYKYENIHKLYVRDSIKFDSTINIIQQHNVNAIEYQVANEIYAKNVGMIYKSYKDLSINLFDVSNINEGKELEIKLINYGK